MANKPTNRLGKQKGRWITIGNPDRDEEEAGTHVYIDDSGTITAGPESLTNKPLNRLSRRQEEQPAEQARPAGYDGPYTVNQTEGGAWYVNNNRGENYAGPYSSQEAAQADADRIEGIMSQTGQPSTSRPTSRLPQQQPQRRLDLTNVRRVAVSALTAGDSFEHEGRMWTINTSRDVVRGSSPQPVRSIHLRVGDYVIGGRTGTTYRIAEREVLEGKLRFYLDPGTGSQAILEVEPDAIAQVATAVGHGRELDVTDDTTRESQTITLPKDAQVNSVPFEEYASIAPPRPQSGGLRAPTAQAREVAVDRPVTELKPGDRLQWGADNVLREIEHITHDKERGTVRLHFTSGRSFTLHEDRTVPRLEMQAPQPETGPSSISSTLPSSQKPPGAGKTTGRLAKIGKSKAKVTFSSTPQQIDRTIGKPGFHKELASLVGAPDNASVSAVVYGDRVTINVSHPSYEAGRYITKDSAGNLYCKNSTFFMRQGQSGQGLGAQVFASQVANCVEQGLSYIKCWAARDVTMNGYYTWPRFGYDESLDTVFSPDKVRTAQALFPGAKSVLDIMETKAGRDWWKVNGTDMSNAKFDLAEGSRSRRVLEAYLAAREAQGAQT